VRHAVVAPGVGSAVLALRVVTVVLKNVYERSVNGAVFSHSNEQQQWTKGAAAAAAAAASRQF
jgi:hypothetical protein